ncbi:MAG: hypothetical protein IKL23_06225 [Oscillospiraceae bacterium]|nr:hypothetical protein [Oscillospiraceae bacterium]
MEKRKQFTFYRSYFEALVQLPEQLQLGALKALIAYALDGTEPQGLEPMQNMAFVLIRPTLDAGRKKAQAGMRGASVTNRQKRGKKKTETEDEFDTELEDDCLVPDGGFESFWNIYPVKLGKEAARKAWQQLSPDADAVCAATEQWKRSKQWKKEEGRFIPRAAKYLLERHFDHAPREAVPMGASGVLGQAELEAIERILRE